MSLIGGTHHHPDVWHDGGEDNLKKILILAFVSYVQ